MVRLGDLGHEDEDGRDVSGGGQAAQQAAHQHHGEVLRGRDEDPAANVGDGEKEECLAASELRAEVAGEKAAKDGADPEDAR